MINFLLTCLAKFELVEKLFKARIIHECDEKYPKDALQMYPENEAAMESNDVVLNDLPGEVYTIGTDDKIPDNCKYQLATNEAAQNQKQAKTGSLAKLIKLKIGEKMMLTLLRMVIFGAVHGWERSGGRGGKKTIPSLKSVTNILQ